VDLGGRFDQILEVGAGEEVSQVDEFAVVFVFDVDDTEFVGTGTDYLAFDVEGLFRADDGEWNSVLDLCVEGAFFLVQFIVIVGVHFDVVEGEFGFNPLLEGLTFCEGEGV